MTVRWGCGARLLKRGFPLSPSESRAALSESSLVVPPCASLERDVVVAVVAAAVVAAVAVVNGVAHHVGYESFAVVAAGDARDGALEAVAAVAVVGAAVVAVEAVVGVAAENAKANAHEDGEMLALGSPYDC